MSVERIRFEDLKSGAERAAKKLRYLSGVIDNTGSVEDLEPCLEMAQSYIAKIADDLESQIKATT